MQKLDGKSGKKQRLVKKVNGDEMLTGWWCKSCQNGTIYLISTLEENRIGMREHPDWRVITIPGQALRYVPHRYYKINSSDGSPCRVKVVHGEHVEGI